jgi:hypothetical protein
MHATHCFKTTLTRLDLVDLGHTVMLDLREQLADLGADKSKDLKGKDVSDEEEGSDHDERGLDEELDETTTSLPVEAAPGVQEADLAAAAVHLRDSLAVEGAVEGDNRVLVLGQDRGLDADQGYHGGQAQEQRAEDGEDGDADDAHGETGQLASAVAYELLRVLAVQAKEGADADGQVYGHVGHAGGDGGRESERLPVALGRKALPEALCRRHGDDTVGPDSVEVGEDCAGESADKDRLAGNRRESSLEKRGGQNKGKAVDGMKPETPETCKGTGVGDDVVDGGADARGDGLLVDEGDGRASLEETLLLALVGRLRCGWRDGDGSVGRLDHAERGDDFLEHVRELV